MSNGSSDQDSRLTRIIARLHAANTSSPGSGSRIADLFEWNYWCATEGDAYNASRQDRGIPPEGYLDDMEGSGDLTDEESGRIAQAIWDVDHDGNLIDPVDIYFGASTSPYPFPNIASRYAVIT